MSETVRLYSDFVCPYCFIAERSVLRQMECRYDIEVDWRPFQLHPEIPPGGVAAADLFGERKLTAFRDSIGAFAAEMGVEIGQPTRVPNTLRALAMTEYARDVGRITETREALMDAYWHRDQDLEDDAVLESVARGAGLDATDALGASDDPAYFDRVLDGRREAHDRMVSGVPTFFFGTFMVVGCQNFETLEKVAARVGLPLRRAH